MSKAADMAKVSVKGSFNILWGLIASAAISAIGAIVLAGVLGEENYGLYSVALAAPNLIGLFKDLGIGAAMTRYIAQYTVENKSGEIQGIILSGFILKTLIGIVLSLSCLLLSPYLSISIFNRPLLVPLIQAISFTILTSTLVTTATAVFTGIEKLHLNSFMILSQSIIKAILSPLFVLLGLSTYGAVVGFSLAYALTVLVGILLVWIVYKSLTKSNAKIAIRKTMKILLDFGLPLSLSSILGGFLTQFYSFIFAIYVLDNALIGNYNMALNFLVLITFLATPINIMLFPAFSKIDPYKEKETFSIVFKSSVKYSSLLVVPLTALLMALAEPAVSLLFNNTYAGAPLFISLLSIQYLYAAFGNFSTINIINSQAKAKIKLVVTAVTIIVGIPVGLVLIATLGVIGLIITALVSGIPSVVIGLIFVKKEYNLSIDWLSSGKILLSSAVAGILTYLIVTLLTIPDVLRLIIGVVTFFGCFVASLVSVKFINNNDIRNLSTLASGLGVVGKLLTGLLIIIKKLSRLRDNRDLAEKESGI